MNEVVWEARGVAKAFGPTRALLEASVVLRAGEIHALCGENGAGKSTMSKVACGVYPIDSGEFRRSGEPFVPSSLTLAAKHGVGLVFQESMISTTVSVAENIFIDRLREFRRGGVLDRARMNAEASRHLETAGADFGVHADWSDLNLGRRKMVEIARAVSRDPAVLFVDEATAVLDAEGRELVMAALRGFRDRGMSICYVSHHMDEIFALTDRITVMRDGQTVATLKTPDTTRAGLESLMVGREVFESMYPARTVDRTTTDVLSLEDVSDGNRLRAVSLALRPGEVVGIAGLAGCGGTELLRIIAGDRSATSGRMSLEGAPYAPRTPRHAMTKGVVFLPGDRDGDGLLGSASVRENIALGSLPRSLGRMRPRDERRTAEHYVEALSIKTTSTEEPVERLSGGNRQKVVFAKLLATTPRILLLDNPTRGVDVGAREQIYKVIADAAATGVAVLLLSEDLLEVLGMSDRVVVLRKGAVSAAFDDVAELGERDILPHML